MGDFNAHSKLWGSEREDGRGRLTERFILSSGACIFNKRKPTYYSTTHNTYSHIELAIGLSILFPLLEWNVDSNPYGSSQVHAVSKRQTRELRVTSLLPERTVLEISRAASSRALPAMLLRMPIDMGG